MPCDARHVRVQGAATVAGCAVRKYVRQTEESAGSGLPHILAPNAEIDAVVEQPSCVKIEIVEQQLIRKLVCAGMLRRDVPAGRVRETCVHAETLAQLKIPPCAQTEPHLVL